MVIDDIRENIPILVCSQLDPLPYGFEIRRSCKHNAYLQYKEMLGNDPVALEKNVKSWDRRMDAMLHPNQGKDTVIDMTGTEMLYNARHRIRTPLIFPNYFDDKMKELVKLNHIGELSGKNKEEYDRRFAIAKPYIDFCAKELVTTLNPSPFHDMEKVYEVALNQLIDFSYSDYPEPLHRIFLEKSIDFPLDQAKHAFDQVMVEGDRLKDKYDLMHLTSIDQRKIAYELFPEYFVTPKDEYIASLIYRQTFKGVS